jgi:cystathionine beta-lyase/cystathionine gamma-synthase
LQLLLDGYRLELIETGVVRYPAFASHSTQAIARRFMRGCAAVISFDVQEHVPPTRLRLSLGVEDVEDLSSDIEAALVATRPS